jgi:hypothetical protein
MRLAELRVLSNLTSDRLDKLLNFPSLPPAPHTFGNGVSATASPGEDVRSERSNRMIAKTEIAELVNGWAFFRDQGNWDALLSTFHDDGTICISWIDGPFATFVAASKLAAGNQSLTLKHYIGVPMIDVRGDRATSEVDVTIMLRVKTTAGEVDVISYARFFDLVEKRNGTWKIFRRTGIYERDRAEPVDKATLPDTFFQGLGAYPAELRFLASTLARFGVSTSPTTVLDKSPEVQKLYEDGAAWLSATSGASAH